MKNKVDIKVKDFRLRGKIVFLTYAALPSDITKETVIKNTMNCPLFKDKLVWGVLGWEVHKTGLNHAHLVVVLNKQVDTKSMKGLDSICNKRGNYQTVRGLKSVIQYVMKDDWKFFGDLDKIVKPEIISILMRSEIELKNKEVTDMLNGNEYRKEYIFKHSGQLIRYEKLIQINEYNKIMLSKPGIKELDYSSFKGIWSKEVIKVFDYINDNLKENQRHLKKKNIHIWSKDPNLGKTTFINCLKADAASYTYPDDNWFERYRNKLYQFIIWDEFTVIGKDISFLKRFFDGQNMRLPMKGSHTMKSDNPLIILLSNAPIRDSILKKYSSRCYCEPSKLKMGVLCKGSYNCSVTSYAKNVYKVLMSRVEEIEIYNPGFLYNSSYNKSIERLKGLIVKY